MGRPIRILPQTGRDGGQLGLDRADAAGCARVAPPDRLDLLGSRRDRAVHRARTGSVQLLHRDSRSVARRGRQRRGGRRVLLDQPAVHLDVPRQLPGPHHVRGRCGRPRRRCGRRASRRTSRRSATSWRSLAEPLWAAADHCRSRDGSSSRRCASDPDPTIHSCRPGWRSTASGSGAATPTGRSRPRRTSARSRRASSTAPGASTPTTGCHAAAAPTTPPSPQRSRRSNSAGSPRTARSTLTGIAYRQELEDRLDGLASVAWRALGEERTNQFLDLIEPVGARLVERIDLTAGPNWMPAARDRVPPPPP